MKIITQSETPKYPFYLHLGYQSASQNPGYSEGTAAFIIVIVFLMALKAIIQIIKAPKPEHDLNFFGNKLFNDKKYNEALEFFDNAIKENPSYAQSYFNKGHTLLKLNMKTEAIQTFQRYLEINQDSKSAETINEIINKIKEQENPTSI
ncbi:MAG: tetratricopeptide repeat protein [Bacteroidales bacterium]|nr:tetratricopeptide repeat protein [Bacteroidales bacterium]